MTKDDLVISYWAIGPTYRRELKENLEKQPLHEDWFNIVILTDYPNDFTEFFHNKNILAVLDLAEQRKHHTWSVELEKLAPATTNEEIYSKEFNKLREVNEKFSYSLHRFSLPWIASNGFSNFVLLDADVRFTYTDGTDTIQYMEEFVKYNLQKMPTDCKMKLLPGRMIEGTDASVGKMHDILADLVEKQFPEILIPRDFVNIRIGDGPIKIGRFNNPSEVFKYFDVWNFLTKNIMGEHRYLLTANHMMGPYVVNDELLVAFINRFLNINPEYSSVSCFRIMHNIFKTRYFAMVGGNYLPANSLEEFLKINNLTLNDIDI